MSVDPRLMEQIAEMKRRQMALSGMPQPQSNYTPPPPTQDAGMASKPAGTMQTLALRQMMFNQDESNRNFSRGNFESDRTFDYGVGRDKRNDFVTDRGFNRGVLESDRGYKRGVFESDRGHNYQVGRDKVQDGHWTSEFNQRVKQDGLQNAISWYNASTSRSNMNNDNARQQDSVNWSRDPKNPDNIYKGLQIEGLRKEVGGSGQSSEKMMQEKQGLVTAFRNGDVNADQATKQIAEDVKLGFYTPEEADELYGALDALTGGGAANVQNNKLTDLFRPSVFKGR